MSVLKRLERDGMFKISPRNDGYFEVRELIGGDNVSLLNRDEVESLAKELAEIAKIDPRQARAREIWGAAMQQILDLGMAPYIEGGQWCFRKYNENTLPPNATAETFSEALPPDAVAQPPDPPPSGTRFP